MAFVGWEVFDRGDDAAPRPSTVWDPSLAVEAQSSHGWASESSLAISTRDFACRKFEATTPKWSYAEMSLATAISDEIGHARQRIEDLVCPDPKCLEDMRPEGIDERDIRRVPASRDDNPPNPWDVVARIECPPRPVE